MSICLHTDYGFFLAVMAELNGHNEDPIASEMQALP